MTVYLVIFRNTSNDNKKFRLPSHVHGFMNPTLPCSRVSYDNIHHYNPLPLTSFLLIFDYLEKNMSLKWSTSQNAAYIYRSWTVNYLQLARDFSR